MTLNTLTEEILSISNQGFGHIVNGFHGHACAPVGIALDGIAGADSHQHISGRAKLFQLLLRVNETCWLRAPYCHDQSLGSR